METIYFQNASEIKREKANLEKKLKVSIKINGRKAEIEGAPIDEYEATRILEAMQFGFSAAKALLMLEEDTIFVKLHIRSYTRRKNLKDVRSRIIGREGKTRRTVEEISGCHILVKESDVGVIGSSEKIEDATTAIINIIKGTKQANAYRYLERKNVERHSTDLGLKPWKNKEE
ncbi:hypothetical protein J4461_04185 [Candidatus Pacearchaeota archaeon]|nr:hypothetical protein [Candidatus Pacearchaeota archaeon]